MKVSKRKKSNELTLEKLLTWLGALSFLESVAKKLTEKNSKFTRKITRSCTRDRKSVV